MYNFLLISDLMSGLDLGLDDSELDHLKQELKLMVTDGVLYHWNYDQILARINSA